MTDKIQELEAKVTQLLEKVGRLFEAGDKAEADKLYNLEVVPLTRKINKLYEKELKEF